MYCGKRKIKETKYMAERELMIVFLVHVLG